MDDGRSPRVEEVEATQDLSSPAPDDLGLDGLQTTHVSI